MRKLALISAMTLALTLSACSKNDAAQPEGCQPNCPNSQSEEPSTAASDVPTAAASEAAK